ncbi:hypothetical protein B0I35DRAFT_414255 [Stachybotrys elegans]|uniref:Serine protease n=1 Tax=Stachybotrys elegans TaxID=80388 RepID=A0A8K0SAD4_9HYPO|nr:hypothetical protein B0I35DRAFT_414255 [Stachybotrys elegans]
MAQAAVWTLKTSTEHENISVKQEECSLDHGGLEANETIIGNDGCVSIRATSWMAVNTDVPIVKIQARFGDECTNPVWFMGTGWLIQPDLLVTAGHVVYNWANQLGEAQEIRCYIGYQGRASIGQPHVQLRSAVKVATAAEWVFNKTERLRGKDVAFIQVDRPFEGNLRLFQFMDTYVSNDSAQLGVVGYPGDKSMKDEERDVDEKGAEIQDLPLSAVVKNTVVIGTHCYGGGGLKGNSGNAIGGKYGNDYKLFVNLFKVRTSTANIQNGKATLVPLGPTDSDKIPTGQEKLLLNQDGSNQANVNDESFADVLGIVAQVGSVALPVAGTFLGGPLGGSIATVAGSLLGMLANAESCMENPNGLDQKSPREGLAHGAVERAIVAEAALQAILSLKQSSLADELLGKIEKICQEHAPDLDALAIQLGPTLTAHGMKMAVQAINRNANLPTSTTEAISTTQRLPLGFDYGGIGSYSENDSGKDLLECLLSDTLPISGEESFISGMGSLLATAVTKAKPFVTKAAKAAVEKYGPQVISALVGKLGGTESVELTDGVLNEDATRFLLQRAIVADASLQVLSGLKKSQLENLKIQSEVAEAHGLGEEEGVIDFLKTAVQKLAPIAIKGAKAAVKELAPGIISAATQSLSGLLQNSESGAVGEKLTSQLSIRDRMNGSRNRTVKVTA